jgi:hypothetical protein
VFSSGKPRLRALLVRYVGEFGIHKNIGPDVDGVMDRVEDGLHDFHLTGVRLDGLDPGGRSGEERRNRR